MRYKKYVDFDMRYKDWYRSVMTLAWQAFISLC